MKNEELYNNIISAINRVDKLSRNSRGNFLIVNDRVADEINRITKNYQLKKDRIKKLKKLKSLKYGNN